MQESRNHIQLMSLLSGGYIHVHVYEYSTYSYITVKCAYFGSAVFQTEGENFWEKSSRTF